MLLILIAFSKNTLTYSMNRSSIHHEDTLNSDLPPGLQLILPPATTYHRETGLPANTCIVLPKSFTKYRAPNKRFLKAIALIKKEQFAEGLVELNALKAPSSNDIPALIELEKVLEIAYEKADNQQQEIWDTVDNIGIASLCCIALEQPLRSVLAAPPEIACALYSSTACIMYCCWRHARKTEQLEAIQKYLSTVSVAPPMYTIFVPPPELTMTYDAPSSSKLSAATVALEGKIEKE